MNNKTFLLTILTPFGKFYEGQVSFLSVKSNDFVLGILPNHAPLISTVDISKLIIKDEIGKPHIYAVNEGAIHIKESGDVLLMVKSIEGKDSIDINRAKAAKKRAEDRLNSKSDQLDVARAKNALLRAINRINIFKE